MKKRLILPFALAVMALTIPQTQFAATNKPYRLPDFRKPDFSGLTLYRVLRVNDDASFVVGHKSKRITVRLAGVNPPIKVLSVEHYDIAYHFTNNLLKGERLYLIDEPPDQHSQQQSQRLAYAYRAPDGLFINAEIIRQGYARAYEQSPAKYAKQFKQLEQFARKAHKGLWSPAPKGYRPPKEPQPLQEKTEK
jgi:micrococcal nuclease